MADATKLQPTGSPRRNFPSDAESLPQRDKSAESEEEKVSTFAQQGAGKVDDARISQ